MEQMIPVLTWAIGLLVVIQTGAMAMLYREIRAATRDAHDELKDAIRDAENTHKDLWSAVNHHREIINKIDNGHQVKCAAHENTMSNFDNRITELKTSLYKARDDFAVKFSELTNKLNQK